METKRFQFGRLPRMYFGGGGLAGMDRIVAGFGRHVLVVTGARSLTSSGKLGALLGSLRAKALEVSHLTVEGEPSPELVDRAVAEYRTRDIRVVVAVGGGSVLDAGKAISAMLLEPGSAFDYLEGVGSGAVHSGRKVPLVAVPTTAGTGSEATKNAVLSRPGPAGFKRSLRHDNFVPDVAVVDPELSLGCPPAITAACGMDALTQLLESYVSTGASPMTDALAESGLDALGSSLVSACTDGADDVRVRGRMAYGALMSGITLANAGLGLVHGFAAAIGGLHEIPHGVVCGTLMGVVNAATIRKLRDEAGWDHPALRKYARAGALLRGAPESDTAAGCRLLLETIFDWTERLRIPRLGTYGIRDADLDAIIAATDPKSHPLRLDRHEIRDVLLARL